MSSNIYALCDPSGQIRYIGKAKNPRQRLHLHNHEARKGGMTYKCRWIRSLWQIGMIPTLFILEEGCNGDGDIEEIFHIKLARADGLRLTNATDGGEGQHGRRHTEAAKAIIGEKSRAFAARTPPEIRSARAKEAQNRPEMIALKSRNATGRIPTQEARDKLRAAHLGRKYPPEVGRKISLANKGRKWSDESRARGSAAQKKRPKPSDATRAIWSKQRSGRKRKPEHMAACLAAAHAATRGSKWTEERRAKMKGRIPSLEERAACSAGVKAWWADRKNRNICRKRAN